MSIDTAAYKTKLLAMQDELTTELSTVGIHNPEVESDWIAIPEEMNETLPDLNDAADRVEEWDERRALVATLENRYNAIKRALKKIEDGGYGVCELGGETIEEARLAANPAARTCMTHKESESELPA
ncbi:TraR/DksA C4-type zinc finger protein [Candidatus Kaiserbacteria bacterium]|nr:TraR/DksA C4-type zinc finger protein [Candidatus Kaiserbacteria bacterium]